MDSRTLVDGVAQDQPTDVRLRRRRSRRDLLSAASILGSWLARPSAARADAPFSATHWLVNRLTMGWTPEEQALADSLGYANYLEYHLNYTAIDDSAIDARIATYTTLSMQPYQLIGLSTSQLQTELTEAAILRSVFSKRQLYQRMVEFWTDHFNIDITKDNDKYLKTIDDRDVIRANALNTFPALLSASAHSPCMMEYLDNDTSVSGNANENYARELMELHTLSVNGGYTQTDVTEVARCLTGWQYYSSGYATQTLRWTFRFNSGQHDNGAKTVLGHAIPAGSGINDMEGVGAPLGVLKILTDHPSTANFIATKLCKWFYSYSPPQSLIDAVAATYTSTGGDIKAMIRTLFNTCDPAAAPLKYKRPYHHFVSALRATAAAVTTSSGIRTNLTSAGHLPFIWGPPDGYPDTLDAWVGLILPRWNFGASLLNGNISGSTVDVTAFFQGVTATADAMADQINARLFGGAMPTADRNRVRDYLLPNPPSATRQKEAIGLAIGSPGYQWY